MSDFQKYLDEAFSKINTSDFSDSEEDLPRDDVYKAQRLIHYRRLQKHWVSVFWFALKKARIFDYENINSASD